MLMDCPPRVCKRCCLHLVLFLKLPYSKIVVVGITGCPDPGQNFKKSAVLCCLSLLLNRVPVFFEPGHTKIQDPDLTRTTLSQMTAAFWRFCFVAPMRLVSHHTCQMMRQRHLRKTNTRLQFHVYEAKRRLLSTARPFQRLTFAKVSSFRAVILRSTQLWMPQPRQG